MNKEIEITYLVNDRQTLEKKIIEAGAILVLERILDRDIYKNGGDYFIRYSTEVEGKNIKKFFTMKEDGDMNSLNIIKKRIEIEFPIEDVQEQGLKDVFKVLDFKKTNSYKKERKAYQLFDCDLSIDIMDDKTYFEIEFKNERNMNKVITLVKEHLE